LNFGVWEGGGTVVAVLKVLNLAGYGTDWGGGIICDFVCEEMDEDRERKFVSCDRVRKMIADFLATKEMTQTEFLKRIHCNSNSYQRFMKLKGSTSGSGNGVYWGALDFFEARKQQEKEEKARDPAKYKRKMAEQRDEKKVKKAKGDDLLDRMGKIRSEGEGNAMFVDPHGAVYDNCDVVRKKIREFLAEGTVTLTGWLKFIGNVNNGSYQKFMSFTGKGAGAANATYVPAYWFFEQKRVMEGQPKSKARIEAEKNFGEDGYSLRNDDGKRWVCKFDSPNPDIYDIDKMAAKRRMMEASSSSSSFAAVSSNENNLMQ
jgi:hypothetical protein